MTTAAGAHDQPLVAYYAASVFMSFLVGLLTMDRLARRECRHKSFVMNLTGAIVVAFTLIANLAAERRGIASTRATEHHD